ncbi:MAG TPA: hypothetical protein VJ546_11175 [Bacillales bacterium]|nr:hypothetical protein [Bacillales bacterium]
MKDNLKLDLSFEKTKITNIRKRYMTFLGFDYKRVRGKSRTGFISRSRPDLKRLLDKIQGIKLDIYMIRKRDTYEKKIADIILVNSKIRGVLNYYKRATLISPIVKKYARALQYAGWNSLAPIGARWIPANKVDNLIGVHSRYQTAIPAIPILPQSKKDRQRLKLKRKNLGSEEKHLFIGITSLVFVRHEPGMIKFPSETPYSDVGRTIYFQRTGRKSALARADELRGLDNARTIAYRKMSAKKQKLYNFEFVMNRCYAFVRDKGKCRVCGQYLRVSETNTHHINPNLPINEVNKVNNLASVHIKCHNAIHSPDLDLSNLTSKELKKILTFRKKLEISKLN